MTFLPIKKLGAAVVDFGAMDRRTQCSNETNHPPRRTGGHLRRAGIPAALNANRIRSLGYSELLVRTLCIKSRSAA